MGDFTTIHTPAEHIAWVKERALAELDGTDRGRAAATASFTSDLRKHERTRDHTGIELGVLLAIEGHMSTDRDVREFIDGLQ